MNRDNHHRKLEKMFRAAPINELYKPTIRVDKGKSEIEMNVTDTLYHAAGAVHGSVYFKMLDDAAFFAANSLEPTYFVLTTTFTTYFMRPLTKGQVKSIGNVITKSRSQIIAESILYDNQSREVGRGNGIFAISRKRLDDSLGYNS